MIGAMKRLATILFLAALPACANPISGSFDGTATLTPTGTPGMFTHNFSGDGSDAVFGSFEPGGQSTVDFSHPPNIAITDGTLTNYFPT